MNLNKEAANLNKEAANLNKEAANLNKEAANLNKEAANLNKEAVEFAEVEETLSDNEKEDILNSFQSDDKVVEVVFSFDTTGSMYSCLATVRKHVVLSC